MFSRLFSKASHLPKRGANHGHHHAADAGSGGGDGVVTVEELGRGDSTPAAGGSPDAQHMNRESQAVVGEFGLKFEELHPRVVGHQGVPATASILAFEATQSVLAVASLDGRIKLFGAPGIEVLLQSPLKAPCKYLEFMNYGGQLVNVTTQNDIEVWDLEKLEIASSMKWEHDITAFAVLQGTTYMYVGDDVGTVSVLQYDENSNKLIKLPHFVPAYVTLGGLVKSGSHSAPSVVGILPQLNAAFSRLVIAYANGLLVLWDIHDTKVLAIRGGIESQRKRLAGHEQNSDPRRTSTDKSGDSGSKSEIEDEEEEEREICSICWACQNGSVLAAGYVDGDVLLWTIPTPANEGGSSDLTESNLPFISGIPLRKIDLAPSKSMKMPVILLKWCASGKGGKDSKDLTGQLLVYGGSDLSATPALTALSLHGEVNEKLKQLEIPLQGPFADAVPLSRPGGNLSTRVAGILVLTSPGLLHMYDGAGIVSRFFTSPEELVNEAFLEPLPWETPLKDAVVSQLFMMSIDSLTAKVLFQLSSGNKDPFPTLAFGTKWPITGGLENTPTNVNMRQRLLLVTGRKRGGLQVWDASTPLIKLLCTVNSQVKKAKNPSAVSAVALCEQSGLLAYGDQEGKVYIFKLNTEAQQVPCKIIGDTSVCTGEPVNCTAGYQCIAELCVHQAAISSIAISSDSGCLATGDKNGMISLLDLTNLSLSFSGCWPSNSSCIARLRFSTTQVIQEESAVDSSASVDSNSGESKSSANIISILYAVNEEASMVVMNGSTGELIGPGPKQPETPSRAICLDLVDVSTTAPPVEGTVEQESCSQLFDAHHRSSYIFLCTSDWIQSVSISPQGIGNSVREVKLKHPCCWASTFETSNRAFGAILVYHSGVLEIRSLPDLGILVETTLAQCLCWEMKPSDAIFSSANARITSINEGRELVHLSVLAEDTDLSMPDSLPRIFDKDLGAAAAAAMKYTTSLPRKKPAASQGLLGVIKSTLEPENAVHPASQLPKLFSSQPFTAPVIQPSDLSVKTDSLGIDVDLEIDDILIDLGEMGVCSSPSASGESSTNKIVLHRVTDTTPPKGKEVMSEETTRSQLFGDDGKPRQRTTDEIKARYGYAPKAVDATNAAAMARDKLMERGEKLQSLNDKTEEMALGAENFASLAEQLAKKYEKRKWWEF